MGRLFQSGRQKRSTLGTGIFSGSLWGITSSQDLVPRRFMSGTGAAPVSSDEAMKNSAVWAAIRMRADLVSTLPWRVYRNLLLPDENLPYQLDASPSPVMRGVDFLHFLYASQVELDRSGNSVGIIKELDSRTKIPAKIQLVPSSTVSCKADGDEITEWKISGVTYKPEVIWHEKQYVIPGFPLGLSPVMYSAYTLEQYRSIQDFATEWFTSGSGPRSSLQNTEKKINGKEAAVVAESWKASQAMDEPFIHGNDWEYKLLQAQEASADWIEGSKLSLVDVARFFNCPADLLDAAVGGSSNITYANVVQRNLQFLVMHLGPTITRREAALTDMLPQPRFFEFDTDYLMRMDPETRANWVNTQIQARILTPNEGRAIFGRDPLSESQYEEYFKAGLVHGKAAILPGDPQDPNSNPAVDNQIDIGAESNG